MAADILVIICSGNGLSPVRHRTVDSSNGVFCQLCPKECIVHSLGHMKCCVQFSAILLWCQRANEGSMNIKLGLSPVRHRAINSSNAEFWPILPSAIYFIEVHKFLFRKIAFEMPSSKCRPLCSGVKRVNEGSINSKIWLVEVLAWCQHGVIGVLDSVLTKCLIL